MEGVQTFGDKFKFGGFNLPLNNGSFAYYSWKSRSETVHSAISDKLSHTVLSPLGATSHEYVNWNKVHFPQ